MRVIQVAAHGEGNHPAQKIIVPGQVLGGGVNHHFDAPVQAEGVLLVRLFGFELQELIRYQDVGMMVLQAPQS